MNAGWWPRHAFASDTANPPRTTIYAGHKFDPSSSDPSSKPPRSRIASNAGVESSRKLTMLVNALGIGGSSLSKSKSRQQLRSSGTSSTRVVSAVELEEPRQKENERAREAGCISWIWTRRVGRWIGIFAFVATAAFPSLPDLTGFGLLRRSAAIVASGSGPRPAPQRSHSAQPCPGNSHHVLTHPPRTPTSDPLRLAPLALPVTPTSQSAQLHSPASPLVTPSSGSHGRTPTAPSWRVDSASPISAQQIHMHALALQNSKSVMGALVYRLVDELSLSGDENELFGTKEPISGGPDPATL
ncbi:hypothetical protein FRC06_002979 [Ceratobasidium sp. 370]|nr:hypothetical protein FRC06_002979 [Ceratobasidium sp. 370]